MRRAGLSISMGVAAAEAERLNRAYVHSVTKRRPYVTLKAGMTLDGKIAASSGDARWITSPASRREVHRLRAESDAVMVGIDTVIADDPALTARTGARLAKLAARQPVRIVVDSRLRVPQNARILAGQHQAKTWIATTESAPRSRRRRLARKGIDVLVLPRSKGRVSLSALLKELDRRGIRSLLVEGGSELNAALLRSKLVDRVRLYIAPSLLGGQDAKGLIGGKSPTRVAASIRLRNITIRSVGGDVVVAGDV